MLLAEVVITGFTLHLENRFERGYIPRGLLRGS